MCEINCSSFTDFKNATDERMNDFVDNDLSHCVSFDGF